MTRFVACVAVIGLTLMTGCCATQHGGRMRKHQSRYCSRSGAAKPVQVLRHVVLFKFTDDTTPEQVREIENAFAALPSKIDAIHDFEWGTDVSVENKADGFTHCFFVTFKSEADRAEYLPHPDHKAFGQVLHPHLEKVLVLDYWTAP